MKIFWSWQSDINPDISKHFIKKCLEKAIKKINKENSENVAVIISKGSNIEGCMVFSDNIFTEETWCNVDHQSTENLINGTLIAPKIAIIEVILITFSFSSKILQAKIYMA